MTTEKTRPVLSSSAVCQESVHLRNFLDNQLSKSLAVYTVLLNTAVLLTGGLEEGRLVHDESQMNIIEHIPLTSELLDGFSKREHMSIAPRPKNRCHPPRSFILLMTTINLFKNLFLNSGK